MWWLTIEFKGHLLCCSHKVTNPSPMTKLNIPTENPFQLGTRLQGSNEVWSQGHIWFWRPVQSQPNEEGHKLWPWLQLIVGDYGSNHPLPHGTSLQHTAEMGRRHIFQPTADILLCMHAVIMATVMRKSICPSMHLWSNHLRPRVGTKGHWIEVCKLTRPW